MSSANSVSRSNHGFRFFCGAFEKRADIIEKYRNKLEDGDDIFYDAMEYHKDDGTEGSSIDVGVGPMVIARHLLSGRSLLGKNDIYVSVQHSRIEDVTPTKKIVKTPPLTPEDEVCKKITPNPSGTNLQTSYDPPPPPKELPLRFLRAGKGDPVEGQRRYEQTLVWRKEYGMDSAIKRDHRYFEIIKANYPQFFHLRSKDNQPVWYEKPPKTNLKALRNAGLSLDEILQHYAMVTEFGWQYLERDDLARSVTVIDLEGMRFTDFAGDVVDFVRKASAFTGQHYPERAGHVFVINVPSWFKMIWNVVKGFVDEVTLEKISIVRGAGQVTKALEEKIDIENIPPEYGGKSMPLGQSPEEESLRRFMEHNNQRAINPNYCKGTNGNPPCKFCTWSYARSY